MALNKQTSCQIGWCRMADIAAHQLIFLLSSLGTEYQQEKCLCTLLCQKVYPNLIQDALQRSLPVSAICDSVNFGPGPQPVWISRLPLTSADPALADRNYSSPEQGLDAWLAWNSSVWCLRNWLCVCVCSWPFSSAGSLPCLEQDLTGVILPWFSERTHCGAQQPGRCAGIA